MATKHIRSGMAPQQRAGRRSAEKILLPSVLVLLTFLAFSPVIDNDFVNYDDTKLILKNPLVINGNNMPVGDFF